ncbi:MAG TPA: DUF2336 domain-containing protein [Rhizomicrobium sp.]|nr:DUF2336 domain-containing protein [Rhizomicrobium sp.]
MEKTPAYQDLSKQEGLSPRTALDILEVRSRETQAYLAQRTDAGDAVLGYLAEHGAPATRAAVAANLGTPAHVNRMLADDDDENVRVELAKKIGRLMPGLEAEQSAHIVNLTIETLEYLAGDSAVRVRAALAEEIKLLANVPRAVVLALAHDLEEVVAAPILEYSPLLSDADLIEIIACGQVREVLTAVARRRPLNEKICDTLVQSLDVSAVAALLVNPDAKIRKQTLERVVDDAEEIESWHLPLALRADLSARAIRRIAGFVGAAIIERLAARQNLSAATRTHLNRQLRLRLEEKSDDKDAAAAAAGRVANAKANGVLDASFIEDAALAGQRECVILAIAELARVSDTNVRRILACGRAQPLVALAWRASLPMRIAFKIQTFVMKLPAQALLPARGGVGYPLTPEEMSWQLSCFGIALGAR